MFTHREVGKIQADKQQGRKYKRGRTSLCLSVCLYNGSQTPVQVVSVGVSHSSNEALEREWSEGETLWC